MTISLKRRAFLKALSAIGVARGLPACAEPESSVDQDDLTGAISPGNRTVVVLGGGLAGMCAAYELQNRGYEVVGILEAQKRAGGRVLTVRDGLEDGQYVECGATRIADSHDFTLRYVDAFGIPLRELPGGDGLYHLKGRSWVHKDGDAWPDFLAMKPEERRLGADSLVLGYEGLEELGDPRRGDWPSGKALDYDRMGIIEYLKARGASDDVVLIDKAINGSELDADAALYWLMADVVDKAWDKTFAMKGGNDQLPKAFASRVGKLIRYECRVKRVLQEKGGVRVTYTQNGQERTVAAALCVCAIPFSVLRDVDLAGAGLTPEKLQTIRGTSYMPVSRCAIQTRSRFWKAKGIGGLKIARTDTPIERLWDLSAVQDGERGLFTAYMQNQNGLAFAAQSGDRVKYVRDHVRGFFPEIDQEALGPSVVKIWQDDPFVKGAWAYYKKGEVGRMMPLAKRREGRVFFCGEHTSAWSGWMQGALESANRVVAEIVAGA